MITAATVVRNRREIVKRALSKAVPSNTIKYSEIRDNHQVAGNCSGLKQSWNAGRRPHGAFTSSRISYYESKQTRNRIQSPSSVITRSGRSVRTKTLIGSSICDWLIVHYNAFYTTHE